MKSTYRTAFLVMLMLGLGAMGHAGPEADAPAVIKQSIAAYRSMKSLSCQEQIKAEINHMGRETTLNTSATIRLAQPDLFYIAWSQPSSAPKAMHMGMALNMPELRGVVWNNGQGAFHYMDISGKSQYQQYDDKLLALAAATGVSSGAAHTLPTIFFDWMKGINLLADLQNAKLAGTESVGDEPCDVIEGVNSLESVKIWISRKSRLILKIVELRGGGRQAVTTPELTDKQLEEALKGMGRESTPESRERLRDMMKKAHAASGNMQLTSTLVFLNVKPDIALEKRDFTYAAPKDAVLQKAGMNGMNMHGMGMPPKGTVNPHQKGMGMPPKGTANPHSMGMGMPPQGTVNPHSMGMPMKAPGAPAPAAR